MGVINTEGGLMDVYEAKEEFDPHTKTRSIIKNGMTDEEIKNAAKTLRAMYKKGSCVHDICESVNKPNKTFIVEISYYFDVTPDNTKTATFEIEAPSKNRAVVLALRKWPNSELVDCKEKD